MDRTEMLKKGYACVYHLLRSAARLLLLWLYIVSACLYNEKICFSTVLILNANFNITDNVVLIM